jgi:hypothetical protein
MKCGWVRKYEGWFVVAMIWSIRLCGGDGVEGGCVTCESVRLMIINLASFGCGINMHIYIQASHYLTSIALRYILIYAPGAPRIDASIPAPVH